jgi:hypothetical protein
VISFELAASPALDLGQGGRDDRDVQNRHDAEHHAQEGEQPPRLDMIGRKRKRIAGRRGPPSG